MSEVTREDVIKDIQESADRMGLDLEDLQDMMEDVLEDCLQKAIVLVQATEEGKSTQVKEIAHDIKGATANYGLLKASSIALELEKEFELLPVEKAKALVTEINFLYSLNLEKG